MQQLTIEKLKSTLNLNYDRGGKGHLSAWAFSSAVVGASRTKRQALNSAAQVTDQEDGEDDGTSNESEGGRETIERLKDDLFSEDEETPSEDLSTHKAQQAQIAAQIAELESKNVGPKDWMLMGETTLCSRPINSLLEEDLEFDRTMKAVPVVTEESVQTLEGVIKKWILDNQFNDVVRKRPVEDKLSLPSRLFKLDDQKSAQLLAQINENEYTANENGTGIDD
ncbi:Mpp10 protein-domain-containing protein [Gautieria morchelliformis]|nr:Mpp10 protein-domain-containing protein [Gautieria morchelliformis]